MSVGAPGDCPGTADHTLSQMGKPGDKELVTAAQACGDQGPLVTGSAHLAALLAALGMLVPWECLCWTWF